MLGFVIILLQFWVIFFSWCNAAEVSSFLSQLDSIPGTHSDNSGTCVCAHKHRHTLQTHPQTPTPTHPHTHTHPHAHTHTTYSDAHTCAMAGNISVSSIKCVYKLSSRIVKSFFKL